MTCHLNYFDKDGAFDSQGYVGSRGINLESQCIGDIPLSQDERAMLTRAISISDNDTKIGCIGGIVHLIGHVEQLLDSHHQQHDHSHTPQTIITDLLPNPLLAKRYSLAMFFRPNVEQQEQD